MKRTRLLFVFIVMSLCSACQLQFTQTGENSYTLTGIKSSKTVERENQAKIQKRIERADFLLDSLNTERTRIISSYNLMGQAGLTDKQMETDVLKIVSEIDRRIEYVSKKKQEFLNEMK